MFKLNIILITAFCAALLLNGDYAIGKEPLIIDSACQLEGVCGFYDAQVIYDYYGSGRVTLVDEKGNVLKFFYGHDDVRFGRADGSRKYSVPGSPEEHCLLAAMKRSFEKAFNPPLKSEFDTEDKQAYWTQVTVSHFIKVLERRCEKK